MKDKLEKVKTTRLLSTKWKLFLGVGNMYGMRGEGYRGLAVDDDDVMVINHHLNSHRPHSRLHLHLPQLPHPVFRVRWSCKVKVNTKVHTPSMLWHAWVKGKHYRFCRPHWTWQDGRVRTWYSARTIDSLQTEKTNLHKNKMIWHTSSVTLWLFWNATRRRRGELYVGRFKTILNIFKSHKHVQGMTNLTYRYTWLKRDSVPLWRVCLQTLSNCMHALHGVVGISAATNSGTLNSPNNGDI